MESSLSNSSVGVGSSQGNLSKSTSSGQWLSMRRIFRDFRRFGTRRQSRKISSTSQRRNEVATANSCSFYLDENDTSPSDDSPSALIECPVCTLIQPVSAFPVFAGASCHHRTCYDCVLHYVAVEITESRTDIACPVCSARIHPDDIRNFLANERFLLQKYEEFSLRRALVVDPDVRWCPAPDCGYAVIAAGCASCPKLRCDRPGCGALFCYHCKQIWHPNQTCAAARAKRLSSNHSSLSIACSVDSNLANPNFNEVKACPRCGALIVKMDDGSCNHMTCTICAAEFCWLCMQEISDIHYLSPSGCTFWGKKQWSRKKKILLQLGMIVGGPIGIALIAVAAIPAIIIGLPVWVGSKLFKKFSKSSRHRRNLATLGSVLLSIIISPLLSVLVVVVGVPLLLAYVYGIVPVSLCRSIGNCDIKTTATGRVKINFDEDDDCSAPASLSIGPFLSSSNIPGEREVLFGISPSSYVRSGASDSHLESVETDTNRVQLDFTSSRLRVKQNASSFSNRLEVHAEVSSRSVVSPHGSLTDGLSCMDGVTKARSTATVSFSDIISTSQDVVSGTIFESPPSEICMDFSAGGLRSSGRSASIASSGASSFLPRSIVRPGVFISSSPPLTKRSVSFVRDLGTVGGSERCSSGVGRSRRSAAQCTRNGVVNPSLSYKRQCMSVGDSIDERIESTASTDYLSIRSLASPTGVAATNGAPKLEPCSGGSDIVAMIAASSAADTNGSGGASVLPRAPGYHCLAPTSSVDASDCLSDSSAGSNFGLTSCGLHQYYSRDS